MASDDGLTGNLLLVNVTFWVCLPRKQCGLHCPMRSALQAECFGGPGPHRDCNCCWVDPHSCSCWHLWNEPGTSPNTGLQCEASDLLFALTPPVASASEQMESLHKGVQDKRAQG